MNFIQKKDLTLAHYSWTFANWDDSGKGWIDRSALPRTSGYEILSFFNSLPAKLFNPKGEQVPFAEKYIRDLAPNMRSRDKIKNLLLEALLDPSKNSL